jgi:pimeloyl-ACP methyl ester carboxylesterase
MLAAFLVILPAASRAATGRAVSLRTSDGVTLAGSLYEATRRPAPAVILLHMLTRTREDWDQLGQRMSDAGVHVLTIDFRGHGGSSGVPDVTRFVLDAQAARIFLSGRTDLGVSAVGIAGASVGANVAILVAVADPTIRSLALLSPSLDYRSLRTEGPMQKYGERPALLLAGTDDPYALRSVRALAAAGTGIREMRMLDNAGHGTRMLNADPDLARALVDWFERTLL